MEDGVLTGRTKLGEQLKEARRILGIQGLNNAEITEILRTITPKLDAGEPLERTVFDAILARD
ncbi:MAG: hypothetical protein PUP91_13665 [Rhizonema sp. PD37]|nr:hypothetical protein [Rhizonema sp. PD37]